MKFSGERLRTFRQNAKLSLEQLARSVERNHGISLTKQAFLYYEQGQNCPKADTLPALADVLGCTINDFFQVA